MNIITVEGAPREVFVPKHLFPAVRDRLGHAATAMFMERNDATYPLGEAGAAIGAAEEGYSGVVLHGSVDDLEAIVAAFAQEPPIPVGHIREMSSAAYDEYRLADEYSLVDGHPDTRHVQSGAYIGALTANVTPPYDRVPVQAC